MWMRTHCNVIRPRGSDTLYDMAWLHLEFNTVLYLFRSYLISWSDEKASVSNGNSEKWAPQLVSRLRMLLTAFYYWLCLVLSAQYFWGQPVLSARGGRSLAVLDASVVNVYQGANAVIFMLDPYRPETLGKVRRQAQAVTSRLASVTILA